MEDKILTEKQIKEMLTDKKTLSDLKKIGYMRDEVWLLHRRIDRIEYQERMLSISIQKKHNLDFAGYIGIVLAADAIHEADAEKKMKYYQVFKRNFFMSFGRIFADQGMSGIGESLNEEAVAYAMVQGIHNFIFAYEDGKIYTISVKEFHDYAVSHDTIRKTDKTGEKTYSVPIKMLVRWN